MNYKLAKQLKDAGFKQTGLQYTWYYGINPMGIFNTEEEYFQADKYPDRVLIPTLSELIEACGDIILFKMPDNNIWKDGCEGKWVAAKRREENYLCASDYFIDTYFGEYKTGNSPKEAVAKLWLKLNKK